MWKTGRREVLKAALAAPFVIAADRLYAQSWPSKPIQMIIPFGAGGGSDTATRIIFQKVSEKLGQPIIIENRTGGASLLAAQAVLSLPKDGYAFFINSSQQMITPDGPSKSPVVPERPPGTVEEDIQKRQHKVWLRKIKHLVQGGSRAHRSVRSICGRHD